MTHGNTFSVLNLAPCQQFKVNRKKNGKTHCFPVSAGADLVSLHRILLQAGSINVMGFEAVILTWFVSLAVAGIKFCNAPWGDWRILSLVQAHLWAGCQPVHRTRTHSNFRDVFFLKLRSDNLRLMGVASRDWFLTLFPSLPFRNRSGDLFPGNTLTIRSKLFWEGHLLKFIKLYDCYKIYTT